MLPEDELALNISYVIPLSAAPPSLITPYSLKKGVDTS